MAFEIDLVSWSFGIYILCWHAEPRGGSQDDFELVLKGYFDTIRLGNRPTLGRKKRIKKIGFNSVHAVDTPKHSKKGGAALLGVCRGKVHSNCTYLMFQILLFSFKI